VYARLVSEIAAASAAGQISSPISNTEAFALPYLQACIKEGLRIFPPITSLRERVVPVGGDTICGHYVPGGTNVGINMAGTMLNDAFGPDVDVFRPERWLDQDPLKLAQMERVHELVFGHGGTKCLGIRIASMTLNKAIVEVCTSSIWPRSFFVSLSLSYLARLIISPPLRKWVNANEPAATPPLRHFRHEPTQTLAEPVPRHLLPAELLAAHHATRDMTSLSRLSDPKLKPRLLFCKSLETSLFLVYLPRMMHDRVAEFGVWVAMMVVVVVVME
jgi:hypothetical protein